MKVLRTNQKATIRVFLPMDAEIITKQVDGYGAGFAHVGIKAKAYEIAESAGYPVGSYGTENIYNREHKHIGWLLEVYKMECFDNGEPEYRPEYRYCVWVRDMVLNTVDRVHVNATSREGAFIQAERENVGCMAYDAELIGYANL